MYFMADGNNARCQIKRKHASSAEVNGVQGTNSRDRLIPGERKEGEDASKPVACRGQVKPGTKSLFWMLACGATN